MFTICFFGSSEKKFSKDFRNDIENFIDVLFDLFKNQNLRIITGGYSGIMELVSRIAKEKSKSANIQLEIIGFLYNCYEEIPNRSNDKVISCQTLGERVQLMIESGNLFVAMPGKSGTLHEISHLQQDIKFSKSVKDKNFILHKYWKDNIKYCDNLTFINCENKTDIEKILKNIAIEPSILSCDEFDSNYKSENIDAEINSLTLEIENVISGDYSIKYKNVLALDIAYDFITPETKYVYGINYSYSCNEYKKILNKYLDKYYSLLSVNKEITKYKELNNSIYNSPIVLEPIKKNKLEFESEKEPADFNEWCRYLEEDNVGKLSMWLNRKILVEGKPINLSAFLILDIVIPDIIRKKILLLLERFLIHFLSKIMDEYLKVYLIEKIPIEKYRINKFNGVDETKFRKIEEKYLIPKNSEEITGTIKKVRSTIYEYSNTKEYRKLKEIILEKKDNLETKTKTKISFQYLLNIKDSSNYSVFLYGRMLFLTYIIIFRFSLKDSYELLLNKKTHGFDRATFQRQFHIQGIKKDKTWREKGEESVVIRHEQIIPYISDAEFECLIGICDDFKELKLTKDLIIEARTP